MKYAVAREKRYYIISAKTFSDTHNLSGLPWMNRRQHDLISKYCPEAVKLSALAMSRATPNASFTMLLPICCG